MSGKACVPRGRGVYHTCSCKNAVMNGRGAPLILTPELGAGMSPDLGRLRQKLTKMTVSQPKRKKFVMI